MTEESNRDQWLAQIKQGIQDDLGDRVWREGILTDFVEDVAWWLRNDENQSDALAIRAVAGLIRYGIETEANLTTVAGSPPDDERFRKKLKEEGVPALVCDLLFKKYFPGSDTVAALPTALAVPPAAVAPTSTPRSKDISNQVAAVFEGEVNDYLDDNFQSVLPGCEFSKFKNREIEDDTVALEMDSFSYMNHDTLASPEVVPVLGIYVVNPHGMLHKAPKAAPVKLANWALAANLESRAEKYVVGESYSGANEVKFKAKVNQLEVKLKKMKERHESRQSSVVSDVTTLFGAAILSFTCQSMSRKDQAKQCKKAVEEKLSSSDTPILWRLAQAERFFIVVLSTREGATTCALREITRGIQGVSLDIQGVEIGIQAILGRLDEKAREEGNEEIVAEHQY